LIDQQGKEEVVRKKGRNGPPGKKSSFVHRGQKETVLSAPAPALKAKGKE